MLPHWKWIEDESFCDWHLKEKKSFEYHEMETPRRNIEARLATIQHAKDAGWWKWDRGVAPLFWLWGSEVMKDRR
jgi:hypothetical protein